MKLKFTINYGTQWGENLCVVLHYHSNDGTVRSNHLVMQTTDGQTWEIETAVIESRQHPIATISYYYQVEDSEGNVIRKEWTTIPRTYYFESSQNYVLADLWRDIPLQHHLYSNAYATTCQLDREDTVVAQRVPLYRKTIIFRVSAPQLKKHQSLAIIGSHPALGDWNETRYLKMDYLGCFEWMLSVNVDAINLPIEYKYVIVDDNTHALVAWEEGDNRTTEGLLQTDQGQVPDGTVLVAYGMALRIKEDTWRLAGVVVPVFSLRSSHSYGVGDFGDLRLMIDWAAEVGMKTIQLLPVNDTTLSQTWSDSYPYNIVSAFALHPHYLDIEALGTLKDKGRMKTFYRQRGELNALSYSDYEAVDRVKRDYVTAIFAENGKATLETKAFKEWYQANQTWLVPYAEWIIANVAAASSTDPTLLYYVQYHLHRQLKAAADYAREKGVFLTGDVPIGVNRKSVETAQHPKLFHLDAQTGTPPDAFSPNGQNWGFPTYNWDNPALTTWLRKRCDWMQQYFDAIRIDHVLGFFRTWEIPEEAEFALLGHFSPALPMTADEIAYFGISFRKEFFTRPFINDKVLNLYFGIHSQYVKENFLVARSYGLYELKEMVDTQKKVTAFFSGKGDENSLWIRDGLYRLISNVLFVEDGRQPEMYHPRINVYTEPVYQMLTAEEKDAYMRLYNHYFYQRHNMFWGSTAIQRLTSVFGETRMLCCAEDLGMLPDCVQPVLDQLRILTLEVQSMPKQSGYEFTHLEANPYRSVATISTHDMPPLRLWWEESPERAQRFYITMLQKQGRAPEHLPAHLAEEIIARHLYCPSMFCLLSLQDWLAMDSELRSKNVREERVNTPYDPYNHWSYRMHLTLEELLSATRYNQKLKTMISRSKR